VDRTPADLGAAGPTTFSPNGDGVADAARMSWIAAEPINGTAAIYHARTLVRSWPIAGMTGAVTWTGRNRLGGLLADGRYWFQVAARDGAGNLALRRIPIVIDRTLSTVHWSSAAFAPRGRSVLPMTDRLSFTTIRTAVLTVAIYSGGTVIRTFCSNRVLGGGRHAWTWDGRNDAGSLVAPGSYVAIVRVTSALGPSAITSTPVAVR
jgi:hypothetical protein